MRLTQIKLSGFKSFVDPTQFQVPGQLVGVVGPNGCGKSNIMDAARWVLGESKASELRGESMQDVIFNGSGHRKPAGRASVELVFDNPDGRAAGQWSQYAEIAVKRVLTRDGTSSYYINNQAVRRRDIQDIFLGTGLGPRAYAIIGQGMISRIIEAKPEELRVFLEEAAGVSKYKERRRETENRLSDTRENLTRVDDILRELNANLEKLEAQAVVAQQYRDLQAEQDEKQKLVWLLRRNEAAIEQEKFQREIEKTQLELDSRTADLRRTEADLESFRAAHYAAGDAVHRAQGELYEANSEVASLEAQIKFVIESRNRMQAQLNALSAQRDQWTAQGRQYQDELLTAEIALEDASVAIEEANAVLESQTSNAPQLEQAAHSAQARVTEQRTKVVQVEQALQLESAHQRNADRNLQHLISRRDRLQQERGGLSRPDIERIEALNIELTDAESRLASLRDEAEEAEFNFPTQQEIRNDAQQVLADETHRSAQSDARLSALKQLQQNVQSQGKLQAWLERHELGALPRLWQRLHIEQGWETALESVLRERISALEVGQLEHVRAFVNDAPPSKLSFFNSAAVPIGADETVDPKLTSLTSLLRLNDPGLRALLKDWIGKVFIAETLDEALAQRQTLSAGAAFVVKAGHVVSRDAINFYASDSDQAGMLARQQEIENLEKQLRAQRLLIDDAKTRAVQSESALTQASARLTELRNSVATITQSLHARQLEQQRLAHMQEQHQSRTEQISVELEDVGMQIEHEEAQKLESEAKFESLDMELAHVQGEFEDAQMAHEAAQQQLNQAREQLRQLERGAQEASFNERNIGQRINELKRNISSAEEQTARVSESIEALHVELEDLSDTVAQTGLQDALTKRVARERALADLRGELDALTARLRESDENRLRNERDLDPLRNRITEMQLKEQAGRLNQEQFAQQLSDAQADILDLEAKLATEEGARWRPNILQGELNRIQQAINALGAVNLAALDELNHARERKAFLDAQMQDLTDAINTLEDAIRKIDRETRSLLQDTFNVVNKHFGELFPTLFGGGEARLVMTGDEILDSGVQVVAQPPGKKNSTIHLLSGGEKALTAIALVFAMFQLNPAPFCLLDEVDAPLDDSNTERFCNMVKRMSAQTQFLFISHNKIAMEMAEQLIGVTMQEQGVSRIVAVDMETALGFGQSDRAAA